MTRDASRCAGRPSGAQAPACWRQVCRKGERPRCDRSRRGSSAPVLRARVDAVPAPPPDADDRPGDGAADLGLEWRSPAFSPQYTTWQEPR
jgi:hypothetical protein